MEKINFIYSTIKKINNNSNVSSEDISKSLSFLHELIKDRKYPGSKAEAMQIGGLLSKALSKINK